MRQRSTLPGRHQPSTIDVLGLNFCVRDGNRWDPFAIITGNWMAFALLFLLHAPSKPHTASLPRSSSFAWRFPLSAFASFAPHSLFLRSSPRPISIDKLSHHCVYTVNLSTLSSARGLTSLCCGILFLEGGFTLRCLQRLSRPYFASLLCRWHDNSCTRGTSIPVLSY